MNSDIVCEFPLEELLRFHKEHGKLATMMVKKVDNPSRFGVVCTKPYNEDCNLLKVTQFVEKP